jgi:hypothetical protein
MIMLDAPIVSLDRRLDSGCSLCANGGGGGEGGGSKRDGVAGTSATGIAAAPGGSGPATLGGDGGSGSANALKGEDGIAGTNDLKTSTPTGNGGGGGGGGGAGLIFVPCSMHLPSQNVSPAPTLHCSTAL